MLRIALIVAAAAWLLALPAGASARPCPAVDRCLPLVAEAVEAAADAGEPTTGVQSERRRCRPPMKLGWQDDDRLLYRQALGTPEGRAIPNPFDGGVNQALAERQIDVIYDRFAQAGGCFVRFIVYWGSAENSDGTWYFGLPGNRLDIAVNKALARGFRVLLTLTGSDGDCIDSGSGVGLFNSGARACRDDNRLDGDHVPCGAPGARPAWALQRGTQTQPTGIAPDPGCFGRFVGATVRHFRGRVGVFSLWNEPNHPAFLAGTSPEVYGALYRSGYRAAKRANASARVLIGELSPGRRDGLSAPRFLERAAGSGVKADGVAWHPYQHGTAPSRPRGPGYTGIGDTPATRAAIRRLWRRRLLTRPDGGRPPLLFTEFGYLIRGNPGRPANQVIDDRTRAPWLFQALDTAARQDARLTVLYTGTEYEPRAYPPLRRDDYGLFGKTGEVRGRREYGKGDRTRRAYCDGVLAWSRRGGYAIALDDPLTPAGEAAPC